MKLFKTVITIVSATLLFQTNTQSFGGIGKIKNKVPFGKKESKSPSKDFSSDQKDVVKNLSDALNEVNKAVLILAEVYGLKELARSKYIQARELDPNDQGALEASMGATKEALAQIQGVQKDGEEHDKRAIEKARKAREHLARGSIKGYQVSKQIIPVVKGVQEEIRSFGKGGMKMDLRSGDTGALNKVNEFKSKFSTIIFLGSNYPGFISNVVTTSKKINQNLKKAGIDSKGKDNKKLDAEMEALEF